MNITPTLSIQSLICNCFAPKRSVAERLTQTYADKGMNILVLPVDTSKMTLLDLFPRHNHVETWTSMTVGAKQQYIVANANVHLGVSPPKLLNTDGVGKLSLEMREFLEPLWHKTMKYNQGLMLLCIIESTTMLVNTFPLVYKGVTVGASLYMRAFDDHMTAGTIYNAIETRFKSLDLPVPSESESTQ